jgi:hypothetical protein
LRRDPQTIVAAHRLDPDRKEVYVEGTTDRVFLNWLTAGTRHQNARIIEASYVDIDVALGGERGRLMRLAEYTSATPARILVFVDADTDRLRNVAVPDNVVLTDGRDLEAYVLRPDCIEKMARLGLATEGIDATRLLTDVLSASRLSGALRFASDIDGLGLPFQKVTIDRYARFQNGMLELRMRAFVQTLAQNADISVREVDRIIMRADEISAQFSGSSDLVHGKDAMRLAEVMLKKEGVRPEEGRRMLWSAFERQWAAAYSGLTRVVEFLESP